jgi:hypothetical protein
MTEIKREGDGFLTAITILMVPAMLWRSFVMWKLWHWFAVPIGLMEITYGQAIGLLLLISLIWTADVAKRPSREGLERMIARALAYGFALVVGAIAS